MIVQVQCYAGRKADERPVRFQIGDRDFSVEEIFERWYGPDASFYKVRADDGKTYLLTALGASRRPRNFGESRGRLPDHPWCCTHEGRRQDISYHGIAGFAGHG